MLSADALAICLIAAVTAEILLCDRRPRVTPKSTHQLPPSYPQMPSRTCLEAAMQISTFRSTGRIRNKLIIIEF